jgi:3-dehydroquinate synthase
MKTISTDKYPITIGDESISELSKFLSADKHSSIFILVDENTKKHCFPKIKREIAILQKAKIICIKSGEKNKNIRTCEKIWREFSKQNADRKSLLINLGGGVITDMGGFAASTYKRGIDFINIPTTLLSQVDAAVGGKTGIDFLEFKNQIGTFSFPKAVFIIPSVLKTLNKRQLVSGFAEVIKHGLIADENYWSLVNKINPLKTNNWEEIIFLSVQIKNEIVSKDPYEHDLRKALNFGHTIGHAIESAYLKTKTPLLHGDAIAIGMICEAYLSRKYCGLSGEDLNKIADRLVSVFKPKAINLSLKKLVALMKQDKKNSSQEINFTLLKSIGKAEINIFCSEELIEEAMQYFNTECQ